MRWLVSFALVVAFATQAQTPPVAEDNPFARGEAISLEAVIPANERGIVCLWAEEGAVYGGTTGRAAHLFWYDPQTKQVASLARLEGGVGLSYALVRLADGSFVAGTQADPTGTAVATDPAAVGKLYRFTIEQKGLTRTAKVELLGVPVPGQGIYTLAYDPRTDTVVGNTWPDGHFFSYDVKTGKFKDHGAIAGYRTFETPQHAADLNKGIKDEKQKVRYARQVSRAIVVDPGSGAWTAGANGVLYRFHFDTQKLEKLDLKLPAAPGRESWASLDAAVFYPKQTEGGETMSVILGGTSDGYLVELRIYDEKKIMLRPRGRPLAQPGIQGLVAGPNPKGGGGGGGGGGGKSSYTVYGIGGHKEGMPRAFTFRHGGQQMALIPGGIPQVDGQPSMSGFGALAGDGKGTIYAGERDRIGRLVRYAPGPAAKPVVQKKVIDQPADGGAKVVTPPRRLTCYVVFAPEGTTTDGSGYTAIVVGQDGRVYVGAARYGGYAWLLRFDPALQPLFMDRVVNLEDLTGEHLQGINTQGKIHGLLIVGPDGRIWFVSKQAHEVFGTRPEYGEDPEGYPGGHLCYYDPKTGFSRSMGILKKQEGLMGGAMDAQRNKLYYRTEPKNHFLTYDLKTGKVQDRGNVGAAGRYMAIDKQGAVYTVGRGNVLCRYDPETGYVEDLAVKVEGPGTYQAPYVLQMGPNGKLYGVGLSHPWVSEFDIATCKKGLFPEVTVRNVAPVAPAGMPVQDIHAGVFGKDGKLYFPLLTTGPVEKDGKPQQHILLMRFDPETRTTEAVGVPDVKVDEAKVKHVYVRGDRYKLDYMQGAAVGPDGSLYLMDIYPQLNVVCFPGLTAPPKK
jgi:sugar lactone lactonase YvrE